MSPSFMLTCLSMSGTAPAAKGLATETVVSNVLTQNSEEKPERKDW